MLRLTFPKMGLVLQKIEENPHASLQNKKAYIRPCLNQVCEKNNINRIRDGHCSHGVTSQG